MISCFQSSISSSSIASATVNASSVTTSDYIMSFFQTYRTNFQFGNMEVNWIFGSFVTLEGMLLLFDYLYRCIQGAKLFSRFWSRNSVILPAIHMQDQSSSSFSISHELDQLSHGITYCNRFLQLIPFLWFQFLVIFGVIVVFVWTTSGT
jgi:hypothetical protein